MKEMKVKKEKGITLVALVVTIVVLLILAGVSLNLVIGNNGLIKKAQEAKDKYQEASINTEKGFAEMYDELQTNLGEFPSTEYTKPYLPTGFTRVEGTGLSNGLVIQDGNGNQYVCSGEMDEQAYYRFHAEHQKDFVITWDKGFRRSNITNIEGLEISE